MWYSVTLLAPLLFTQTISSEVDEATNISNKEHSNKDELVSDGDNEISKPVIAYLTTLPYHSAIDRSQDFNNFLLNIDSAIWVETRKVELTTGETMSEIVKPLKELIQKSSELCTKGYVDTPRELIITGKAYIMQCSPLNWNTPEFLKQQIFQPIIGDQLNIPLESGSSPLISTNTKQTSESDTINTQNSMGIDAMMELLCNLVEDTKQKTKVCMADILHEGEKKVNAAMLEIVKCMNL